MRRVCKILSLCLVWTLGTTAFAAKPSTPKKQVPKKATISKAKSKPKPTSRKMVSGVEQKFEQVRRSYRRADANQAQLWSELQPIDEQKDSLPTESRIALLNLEASLLAKAGYPYLASLYAIESLRQSPQPLQNTFAWQVLDQSRERKAMPSLLEELAAQLSRYEKVPALGNSWHYYKALAFQSQGKAREAIESFSKLKITDDQFLSAKYQIAMIHLANDKTSEAEIALRSMLNSVSQSMSSLSSDELKDYSNYAKMALARLYYQDQKFVNAIKFYRSVDRKSHLFYDALFEQSWAFFMAGYPNHALGAIYSVESPFFKDIYNPETRLVSAIVNYWMCRYEDSKADLALFTSKHADAVESLGDFLARKRLTEETAYELFENYVTGVSSQSLGMPKAVLESAAEEDSMMFLRDQYAGVIAEMDRIESQGVFGSKNTKRPVNLLQSEMKKFRKRLGGQFIVELQSMQKNFERLYEQSQFLYVELLMSEKEQLLGRELHASSKMDRVTRRKNIAGWGDKTQAWGNNKLNEFWWDEVGFYISDAKPMCRSSQEGVKP